MGQATKQRREVTAAMHDAKDLHVFTIDVVDDGVIANGEAACTGKKIVTSTALLQMACQKVEPICMESITRSARGRLPVS